MTTDDTFYNKSQPRCLTYLEFGSIDTQTSEKRIWDFRLHQEAYDFLMLARYMKDLVAFRKLSDSIATWPIDQQLRHYNENVFTKDIYNTFSKLAALHLAQKNSDTVSFLELGSTLMGCIDALEYIQKLGLKYDKAFSNLKLTDVVYHAVDISELLNSTALITHPQYKINPCLDWHKVNFSYDVFFAKGVSMLYAVASPAELAKLLSACCIGTFDYSLAVGAEQEQYLGTGKNVKYLSAAECIATLKKGRPDYDLFIHEPSAEFEQSKKRIRGLFYYATQDEMMRVTEEEARLRDCIVNQISDDATRAMLSYRELKYGTRNEYVSLTKYLAGR